MTISDKFISVLQKNYFVLRNEKEAIIVGISFATKVYKETLGMFQPYATNINTTFPVFFLISINEKNELTKEFRKKNIPIFLLNKKLMNSKSEEIIKALGDFIKISFAV